MDYLVVVAFRNKLHARHSALGVFEIIFLDASHHLLECVVHDCDYEVSLSLFNCSQKNGNALHVVVASSTDEEQDLSKDKVFVFGPGHGKDIADNRVEIVFYLIGFLLIL